MNKMNSVIYKLNTNTDILYTSFAEIKGLTSKNNSVNFLSFKKHC